VDLDHLGVLLHWNANAWQTSELFDEFLHAFKRAVIQEKGRKDVVLLLDGFSGHKPPSDDCKHIHLGEGIQGFQFEFILVIWLPPNTTSHIQPLDAGLINSWKVGFFK